jgi:NAD(P)-dependent dehydrogenase (short-subunit alcohol dehydrogenase family)
VVVHNAGHMTLGPVEAFTVEQIAAIYDINVLSTQRVNRAVLPHLRRQRDGLLVWIGSTSARGGTPPWLGPYFAAKAAEDALAVSVAAEVSRFGIDSTIVVPGSFTTGTNHYAHAGHPEDKETAGQYDELYGDMADLLAKQAELSPPDADPQEVARQVAALVAMPKGQRPFRVYIDPAQDGAEEVFRIGDRIRRDFYRTLGFEQLLRPAT